MEGTEDGQGWHYKDRLVMFLGRLHGETAEAFLAWYG